MFFFFFQAEDGIRDLYVTGVQTCALPISRRGPGRTGGPPRAALPGRRTRGPARRRGAAAARRSEERRVGKECRSRWSAYHQKKNVSTIPTAALFESGSPPF